MLPGFLKTIIKKSYLEFVIDRFIPAKDTNKQTKGLDLTPVLKPGQMQTTK